MKINLIGINTYDYINQSDNDGNCKLTIREGGISNIVRILKDRNLKQIHTIFDKTHPVFIYCKNSSKSHIDNIQPLNFKSEYVQDDYDWSHIAYLNYVKFGFFSIRKLRRHSRILSCDIHGKYNSKYLKFFDVIFTDQYIDTRLLRPGQIVIWKHFPIISTYTRLGKNAMSSFYEYEGEILKDTNLIGAGDYFITHLMTKLCTNIRYLNICVDYACKETLKSLKKHNI